MQFKYAAFTLARVISGYVCYLSPIYTVLSLLRLAAKSK